MQKSSVVQRVLLALCLILLVVVGLWHVQPSGEGTGDAAANRFSARRATAFLQGIAFAPHPPGTPAHAKVRDNLLADLRQLGVEPQVQHGFAIGQGAKSGVAGMASNVLARLPGTLGGGKALMLVAHYDSVPGGPGAADDGASVAAMLETLRALKAGPPLQNDVIFLFTDAEEAGSLGAELFVAEHPWAREVGLVLNFEYRGNAGPMMMFETSNGNGRLIAELAQGAPQTVANSLMYEVYRRLPNNSDLSTFKRHGMAGLNFAAIGNHPAYHTRLDSIAELSQATLQQQGEIMLGLCRRFGAQPLTGLQAENRVYFDFPGLGLVHYGPLPMWLLTAIAAGLLCLLLRRSRVAGTLRWPQLGLAMLATIGQTALLAALCQGLWAAILRVFPGYQLIMQGTPYHATLHALAFVLLLLALFLALQILWLRRLRPAELALAAAMLWLVLLLACNVLAPGLSFMLAWPLLALLFGLLAASAPQRRTVCLLLATIPGMFIIAPLVWLILTALSFKLLALPMALLLLLLALYSPLLGVFAQRMAVLPLLLLALGCFVAAFVSERFDADHPRPGQLSYLMDADSGRAYWLSSDRELDPWRKSVIGGSAVRRTIPELYGHDERLFWVGAAPLLNLTPPMVQVQQDRVEGNVRHLLLRLGSPRQAARILLDVEGVKVLASKVQGQVYTSGPDDEWSLQLVGMNQAADSVVTVALQVPAGKPLRLRLLDRNHELPLQGGLPRPADDMVQPFGAGDTSAVLRQINLPATVASGAEGVNAAAR